MFASASEDSGTTASDPGSGSSGILLFILQLLPTSASGALILVTLVLVAAHWYFSGQRAGLPPGPRGLPVVGFLPFMGKWPEKALSDLSKTYGGIVRIYLGSRQVILLNDFNVIKEAFVKQAKTFSGRPTDFNISASPRDEYSVLLTDGPIWKAHRRFAVNLLRDFGMGKNDLEPLIMREIHPFLEEVRKFKSQPTDCLELLKISMSNSIALMMLGKRFAYDDPWIVEFIRFVDLFIQGGSAVAIFTFFPWTKHIPFILKLTNQTELVNTEIALNKNLTNHLKDCKKRHVDGSKDNYINAFLTEQKQRARDNPNDTTFSDTAMLQNAKIMMIGGVETTATTIAWLILYMTKYPKVLKRVQQELDAVVGHERMPSYSDRLRTPYTEATIHELQRISTLAPLAAPHRNLEECHVNGYLIPKNTYVLVNIWSVHNNEKLFDNPTEFRPERFLNPTTGEFVRSEYVIPFSMGHRQCLGESMARMELYLYVTCLAQSFDMLPEEGVEPSLEKLTGIAVGPKYFKPRLVPRRR